MEARSNHYGGPIYSTMMSRSSSGSCGMSCSTKCSLCCRIASLRCSCGSPRLNTLFLHVMHSLSSSPGCPLAGVVLTGTSSLQSCDLLVQNMLICVDTLCAVQPIRPCNFLYGTQCSTLRFGRLVSIFILFLLSYNRRFRYKLALGRTVKRVVKSQTKKKG